MLMFPLNVCCEHSVMAVVAASVNIGAFLLIERSIKKCHHG
tara:strand:+ start:175 stop:297 length:123 start_codon:yes stop_codon:yes gene_type:complete